MHEYDVALKMLLRGSARMTFQALTGGPVEKWLDIELPKVQNLRMDLLGEMADGDMLHLELQSRNDPEMPERMAEYALGAYRLFRRFPRQIVLYVGERPLNMKPELVGPRFAFSYELRDMRDLDGDALLESADPGDNVLAVLGRLRDSKTAVVEIVRCIAGLDATRRHVAARQLIILAGLRGLEQTVEKEIRKMPILEDIMEHKVLGREFRRGKAEGEAKGRAEGERLILRRQMIKLFGVLPEWAEKSLRAYSAAELESLGERLLDARSLEDLLRQEA
jgi:predicted transposase YdaD